MRHARRKCSFVFLVEIINSTYIDWYLGNTKYALTQADELLQHVVCQQRSVLHYGKVKTGIGGGICQLSNLIYWLTIHTPLTVTQRYRHSYDVFPDSNRTQLLGSGATCAYNYLDLQIKNETTNTYQLIVYLTDTHLVGEWRSDAPALQKYEVYEKEHAITLEMWGGYVRHNKIHRKVFNLQHEQIDDDFISENHAIMMYEPMLSAPKVEGE